MAVAAAGRWRGATAAQKTPASQASATGRSRTRAGVNSCMVAAGYAQHGRPRAESGESEAGSRFEACAGCQAVAGAREDDPRYAGQMHYALTPLRFKLKYLGF